MDKEILVADEVAEIMRVDRQRIYALCREDRTFPVIVVGQRQYRFSKSAILRWMENGGTRRQEVSENV